MIDSNDFPTVWGTAAEVADICSTAMQGRVLVLQRSVSAAEHWSSTAQRVSPGVGGTSRQRDDAVTSLIKRGHKGAQFATLDIDTVFQRIPIYPAHKAYLVIQCEPGAFYIDHVYPFGVSSGKGPARHGHGPVHRTARRAQLGTQSEVARRPAQWLIPISDHGRQRMVYVHDVQDIFNLAEVLSVPLHKKKWTPHAFEVKYASFAWDAANRMVALAKKKRVTEWRTLCTPRAVAPSTWTCIRPRLVERHFVETGREARIEAMQSLDRLECLGERFVIGDSWDTWRWAVSYETWYANGRDISWAEMVTIKLALRTLEEAGVHDADVLTEALCMALNIIVRSVYINTKIHRADPVTWHTGPLIVQGKGEICALSGDQQRFRLTIDLSFSPPPLSLQLSRTILSSMEARTRKNYSARLLGFTQFCDLENMSEDRRMPADKLLLAVFVAHYARSLLEYTKKGTKKLEPSPLPKRPLVTLEQMHTLFASLLLSNSFNVAVFAVATAAFWGCHRLGELIILSCFGFNAEKHVAALVEIEVRTLPSRVRYAVFHILWTKTMKRDGADIVLTANPDPTDPITALMHHRSVNRDIPASAPLFSFITHGTVEGWAPMTWDWFLEQCNEVWLEAGLGVLSGHCFCIGGATELFLRGTHLDIVATQVSSSVTVELHGPVPVQI
ncbi:hypothetical protein NUW54_g8 [Trametes sanguinea]|uniref:Uncharacterized protein n=1 Tax=Trametes sanguinea TaxID=158606 RepID=A0ACC1QC47_9APHY|nr:hypothetical protein NUW54_g8 [Trametes sanguinea]